jgi:hypothetical protein
MHKTNICSVSLTFAPRRTTAVVLLAIVTTLTVVAVADARPARVSGNRILDASKHEMKVRGVTWGGTRFVPSEPGAELRAPDISSAPNAFKQIAKLGANVVRVDVSSAANDDVHRIALQKLQRYAHARGLVLLLANVPLTAQDQSPWLSTLASWFPRKDNVWYLPAVDPNCGTFSASTTCGDTEAWIWSQTLSVKALRRAGVRTPIVVNMPNSSRSVALNWTKVLGDKNLIYGVHPPSDGQFKFKESDAKALTTSLEAATKVVPVLFDDVARVQTTTSVDTIVAATTARLKRTTRTTTDSLRWSKGLLDWVTGWTVIDGGDGAIVSGWDTPTRDSMSKGRKKLTTWGRAAASGYFAIGFRAQAGRNPGSDFPGGFTVGDSGPGVRAMQEDLARLTYLAPRFVNGSFDAATWQAVVGFQGYSRLERTGVATALTVASLMRAERPQARHVDGAAHVEVDLDRQVMMLVHGSGVVTRLIHISSGITGNTPAGSFTVTRKERMSWSKPFKAWLPYASYFFEGFAMHEFPEVPEYAASHGCVRIPAGDAAAVYAFTEMGMPVILYHSS